MYLYFLLWTDLKIIPRTGLYCSGSLLCFPFISMQIFVGLRQYTSLIYPFFCGRSQESIPSPGTTCAREKEEEKRQPLFVLPWAEYYSDVQLLMYCLQTLVLWEVLPPFIDMGGLFAPNAYTVRWWSKHCSNRKNFFSWKIKSLIVSLFRSSYVHTAAPHPTTRAHTINWELY